MVVLLITASLEGRHLAKSFFNTGLLGAAGTDAAPSDDQFNRVSFLSHFEGSNNGVNNAFDDGSDSNHTITANGNVTQGSFNPYGTNWAVDFSLDANPRLSCGSSSDFTFGTGDFTVEFFVFFYSLTSYQTPMSAGYNDSGGMAIQTGNANGKFTFYSGGSALVSETTSDAVSNKWYHIAFSRQSGTLRVYRNGVQTGTASNSTNLNRTGNILIGSDQDFNIDGLLSNFRLVKGTSLYNSNFTAPTSPLTAVTNTKLLTLQSNRFVDNSASGHTVTPNTGKETIGSFGPFLTDAVYDAAVNGASAHFEGGDGDYLSLPPQSDFAFGTGDFSVSVWVYFHNVGSFDYLIDGRNSGQTSGTWSLGINYTNTASGKLMFASGSSAILTSDTNLSKFQWYYITVSRSGTTSRMHFNGTQVAINTSDSTNYSTSPNTSYIGTRYSTQHSFDGIMGDVRVVKGTALSSYTPPTAPLTAITNTKLLLNMADAQAIDSAAQNNLTLVGNANTSTDQAKFGDTSLHLDGTGDYVIKYAQDISGTGAFTVEMFLRLAAVGAVQVFYDTRPSGTNGLYPVLFVNSDNTLNYYVSSGNRITSSETLSANTWYHIALCRSETSTKLFLNGTQVGSTYSDSHNYVDSGQTYLGRSSFGDEFPTNGFIDEIRFSKMARYTSNFTAPTAAFADKGQ